MPVALVVLLLVAASAVCAWSGYTLAHHYQDGPELTATLAIAGCIVGVLVLTGGAREAGEDWPGLVLAIGMGAGLFGGYVRGERLR